MYINNNWTLKDLLYLSLSKEINSKDIRYTIENYDSYSSFLDKNSIQKNIFSDTPFNQEYIDIIDFQFEFCEKNKIKIITYWDKTYPENLKNIQYPPNLIFVKGNLNANDVNSIGIVGTRQRTQYGKLITEQFAEKFAQNGIVVVSGLASGIDTDAHLATVNAKGITYAVIASGIDKLSPQLSVKNAEKIVDCGGAIISEYRCGVVAQIPYFPQRNRIIAGISKALLVVESDKKGGSLITARMAIDENKDVYAVPGSINSRVSRGTNQLIKDNLAVLASSPEDIMNDIGFDSIKLNSKSAELFFKNQNEEKIFSLIEHEPIHIDSLLDAENLDIEVSELLVRLLELEFRGYIKQLPGKYYVRLKYK